ncbi:MAG TPA: glycosyltransferase [Rubricoccaceae bacterium]|nr:glycosyltransferase [Rubricoccaceae bacterium]
MLDPAASLGAPPPPTAPVCAFVVTYNRAELLARCLDAVLAQRPVPATVLVIDNASTDGTAALLASRYPRVEVRRLEMNTGASGGYRAGVEAALAHEEPWVWILDDDAAPAPDCLAELLAVADLTGKRAVVPRRWFTDGGPDALLRDEAVVDEAAQRWAAPDEPASAEEDAALRWVPVDVFTFEGPLVHRDAFARVGLPDAGYFISADDTDWSLRHYRAFGPGAAVLARRAVVEKHRFPLTEVPIRSALKRHITGDGTFTLWPDADHWKRAYYLRNRHLLWKRMGWRRRRWQQAAVHLGYLLVDALEARRRGWDWRLRLKANARSLAQGIAGRGGAFLDPAAWHAARQRRASSRPR